MINSSQISDVLKSSFYNQFNLKEKRTDLYLKFLSSFIILMATCLIYF